MTSPIMTMQSNFLVDIKTAVIKALRSAFDDIYYPDDELKGIQISMEYPATQNAYPGLWVNFQLRDMRAAGIGHIFVDEGVVKHEFIFEGDITLSIVALSSKERDTYASQLIQMLAFRDLNPVAAKFDEFIQNYPNIHMTINRDTIEIQGQQTTFGSPWDQNAIVYEDGFAFKVIGQIESTFTSTPEVLKKIVIDAEGVETGDIVHYEVTKNTTSPGEWI